MSGSMPSITAAPMPPSLGGAPGGMPGGAPGGLAPPRPNLGPVTQPQGNPGNMASAMLDVKNALNLLQKALPNIPMGSPVHNDILKAVTSLSKHAQQGGEQPGLQIQSLLDMVRTMGRNPMMGAVNNMMPQPGQGPAMGPPPGPPPG